MAPKVLVFESDPAFADELRSELGMLGCEVTVVDDGNAGLQHAFADRPDLILLSIELPRMNGFSVCNRVKKDPSLKDIPLIIMSSESSDETFEQHKKLRTRAEDYVRKPVAFGELLQRIQRYYPLGHHASSEADIVIDDEIELGMSDYEDDEVVSEEAPQADLAADPASRAVDADVEAFAESAFGRMTRSEPATTPPGGGAVQDGAATAEIERLRRAVAEGEERIAARTSQLEVAHEEFEKLRAQGDLVEHLESELGDARAEIEALLRNAQDAAVTQRELADARREIERLQIEATDAGRLAREVDELRSKLTMSQRPGAISSREFLDLRETLNHRDKEILNLRELVSRKDKEILEAQDRALASERARADLDGRLLASDRELAELRERSESLEADCELAKKARDDFRGRLEKAGADSREKDEKFATIAARHAEELRALEEKMASARAEHEAALSVERDDRLRAEGEASEGHRAALSSLRAEQEEALARLRSEAEAALASALRQAAQEGEDARAREAAHLRQQHANEEAALRHAQDQAIEALRHEAADTAREADETRAAQVAAVQREADTRLAQAMAEASRHEAAALETVRSEHGERVSVMQAEAQREMDAAREQIARLESEGATQRGSLAEAHERVGRLDMDVAAMRSELSALRDEKSSADAAHAAELSEVRGQLKEATQRHSEAERAAAELRAAIAMLEGRLASAHSEVEAIRQLQAEAASRADRARAKWDADRQSLDRAKDALAAALLQIEEAEGRSA
ncbi:MAG: response regulator [Polyangiaceae bacterium]|jgi:DNA-binding response OmpR family regulator/chromosome segregation ATPase